MQVDYSTYAALYADTADFTSFNRLCWDANRKVEAETTGADGVNKLALYPPTDEYTVEAVERCICKLIQHAYDLEKAEEDARNAKGYITRADGTLQGRVVSSVSAGNESISYASATNASTTTLTEKALASTAIRKQIERDIIRTSLSGLFDGNGVPLLYAGEYPRWVNV